MSVPDSVADAGHGKGNHFMKMTIFVGLLGLANVAAMVMVFLNRASEKVVTSYVSITLASVAGLALAISAFADQGGIEERFPISFFVDRRDGHLVTVSTRLDQFFSLSLSGWQHAAVFLNPDNPLDSKPYHLALQRIMIEWMNLMYSKSWRIRVTRYDTTEYMMFGPIPGATDSVTLVRLQDLAGQFASGSPAKPLMGTIDTIALPPGLLNRKASLVCKEPGYDPARGDTGEISIANDFATLAIATSSLGSILGLGEYGAMAGVDEENNRNYMRLDFEITVKAKFQPFFGGHPEMAKRRQWVIGFVELLRDQFDEQRTLARSRDAVAHPRMNVSPLRPHFTPIVKYSDVKIQSMP